MSATYRPSGILLRTLRLERWLCPVCQRDNLLRRGSSILARPCRWCDAILLTPVQWSMSVADSLAHAFASLAETIRRAAAVFAEAFGGVR